MIWISLLAFLVMGVWTFGALIIVVGGVMESIDKGEIVVKDIDGRLICNPIKKK